MDALTLHAPPGIPEMDEPTLHALAVWRSSHQLPVDDAPRTLPRTESSPNPTRHPPDPPARDLGIIPVGVPFHPCLKAGFLSDEPRMARVEVTIMDEEAIGEIIAGCGLKIVDSYLGWSV